MTQKGPKSFHCVAAFHVETKKLPIRLLQVNAATCGTIAYHLLPGGENMLLGKQLKDIVEADLLQLCTDHVQEDRHLEFKRELKFGTDDEKREFLKDVTSFANADGGVLLFGVEAEGEHQTASAVPGVAVPNRDEMERTLRSSLISNVEPRINGDEFRWVELGSGNFVLVIGIASSWLRPHRITFRGWNKFWARVGLQACELDVSQLRQLFLGAPTVMNALRDFRADRLMQIKSGSVAVDPPLRPGPITVLHTVSLNAFSSGEQFALPSVDDATTLLQPLYWGSNGFSYNLDGMIMRHVREEENHPTTGGYAQLLRMGGVEAADTFLLSAPRNDECFIPSAIFESKIRRVCGSIFSFSRRWRLRCR